MHTPAALCLAVISLLPASFPATAKDANPLDAYHNKNRVLLVFAPNAQDKRFQEQIQLFHGQDAGFHERELLRFHVFEAGQSTREGHGIPPHEADALRRRFGVQAERFRMALVGKDGHTAFVEDAPVSTATLFGRIDAMPMRCEEMRRRGER